ncbi:MAG: ABC transporter substrate-binding protein [Gammaproteobacteria bacterium]
MSYTRRSFFAAVIAVTAVTVVRSLAAADQSQTLPTIGEVWLSEPVIASPYIQAFRNGLHDLGYVEGRTVTIVSRFADGDATRLPTLVAELVALKVDVLFVSPRALPVAMRATTTIPIVSMGFADPVAEGVVPSLARPGGNVTGISWQSADTAGKRLELARLLVPTLRRVAILFDPTDQRSVDANAFRSLAGSLGVKTRAFELSTLAKQRTIYAAIARYRPEVLIVGVSPLTLMAREPISHFAMAHRIPLISEGIVMAQSGALLTYGPNELDLTRQTAFYVDKILKGAKPSDLPIQQPMKLELIVNLRTAKSIGVTVPDSILVRADELIR